MDKPINTRVSVAGGDKTRKFGATATTDGRQPQKKAGSAFAESSVEPDPHARASYETGVAASPTKGNQLAGGIASGASPRVQQRPVLDFSEPVAGAADPALAGFSRAELFGRIESGVFITSDRKVFRSRTEAADHERANAAAGELLDSFFQPSRSTNFASGDGFVQHDPASIAQMKALVRSYIEEFHGAEEASRFDGGVERAMYRLQGSPLYPVLDRLANIDSEGREWGQGYFAAHPEEATAVRLNPNQSGIDFSHPTAIGDRIDRGILPGYATSDRRNFTDVEAALKHQAILCGAERIEALLPSTRDPRFFSGTGYVQHSSEEVARFRDALGQLIPLSQPGAVEKYRENPTGAVRLYLNSTPLYGAWSRLASIDDQNREWSQEYIKNDPPGDAVALR